MKTFSHLQIFSKENFIFMKFTYENTFYMIRIGVFFIDC